MKLLYIAFVRMPTEKAHGIAIARSCESFARAGADVTLVVPKRRTSVGGDLFSAYGVERNFCVVSIPVPDLVGRFGSSSAAFWIHHGLFLGVIACRLLFGSRRTVIYSREASACFFSLAGFEVVYECHHIFNRSRLFFWLCRRADRIVTISRSLQQIFVSRRFVEANILVAQSGVDLPVFDSAISKEDARAKLGLPQNAQLAVYTGNFTTMGEDKGLNASIEALRHATKIVLVAVGGSSKDIERYTAKASENGVADRVFLRGHMSQPTLAVYQKAADVLLMPFPDTPHYREHMSPVKMFEYMASGVPIIASDLPTIREVLNERNAVLVAPDDPSALANEIERVANDPAKGIALATAARRDVEAYTWDARAKHILDLL